MVCFVNLCRACLSSPTDPRTVIVNLDCSEASTSIASGKSPEAQKRRLPTANMKDTIRGHPLPVVILAP